MTQIVTTKGKITRVIGPVVDVAFEDGKLPSIIMRLKLLMKREKLILL